MALQRNLHNLANRTTIGRGPNSLQAELENFEKSQIAAISKAINSHETPVKEKHLRSAIIGTHREKSCRTFWEVVTKLPLQGNPIVCWKFCHTVHKLLREGHQSVLQQSNQFRGLIVDLGKLWGHLKDGYGKLIACYCRLLVYKLDFHKRNPGMPGNMALTTEQLDDIGERDMNSCFQLTVEMFDYMDELLSLEVAVFGSLDMSRANSMTASGQCRLAPLILCIQDSSPLYDYCVKLLFKLHSSLPPDVLKGHRDRFLKQFKLLSLFYTNSSNLQYFKNLIQVPLLPSDPPNFLRACELSNHVTPVAYIPDRPDTPEGDTISISDSLVDVESTIADEFEGNGFNSPDLSHEKDRLIDQLLHELDEMKEQLAQTKQGSDARLQAQIGDHLSKTVTLNLKIDELARIVDEKSRSEAEVRRQLEENNRATVAKIPELQSEAKNNQDKFLKMKELYGKLSKEHIALIRAKAEVEKQLVGAKRTANEFTSSKLQLEEQLKKAVSDREVAETVMRSASDVTQQLAVVSMEKEDLERAKTALKSQSESLQTRIQDLESELANARSERGQFLQKLESALKENTESEDRIRAEFQTQLWRLIESSLDAAHKRIKENSDEFDNPLAATLSCAPEYLLQLLPDVNVALQALSVAIDGSGARLGQEEARAAIDSVQGFGSVMAELCLLVKGASNSSPDIDAGDKLTQRGRAAAAASLELLSSLKMRCPDWSAAREATEKELDAVRELTERMSFVRNGQPEKLGDLFEEELHQMESAIEEAAARIQEIMSRSQAADTGIKLEVNGKTLDACTGLMLAIKVLVQRAKDLQGEIVAQGRGTASAKEFYKRNHRWTEGLISAAKAVGMGAGLLVDAADKVVCGSGKFESLMVASQEIAASTAQLVVASKVKADRGSDNLSRLATASKGVTEATGNVVATAKSCSQMLENKEMMDFTKLTLHQAKRLEMESQVRVLELENNLEKERQRLAGLRKQHYMMAGPSEGWETTN